MDIDIPGGFFIMDYTKINKYHGDLTSSDLCDVVVDAKSHEVPGMQQHAQLLVEDLRDAILNAETLYYLVSSVTRTPYLNEHFAVIIFDDRYCAEKYVDKFASLQLDIMDAAAMDYEWLFSYFYTCGAEAVDYCNERSGVTFGLEYYFLPDSYDSADAPARLFARFVNLCMQEIRNEQRVYAQKEHIVTLLKKNIVQSALDTKIFIPVISDASGDKVVHLDAYANVVTMSTENNEIFFPVYTSVYEFDIAGTSGIKIAQTSLLSYIEFIEKLAVNNDKIYGLAVNPEHVNFAMNRGILDIVLSNKSC